MNFTDLFTKVFDYSFSSRWTGECSGWSKELVIYHIVADLAIFIAYMSIPALLLFIMYKRKDIPFNLVFLLFAIFIIGCGLTHLMGAITPIVPLYYLDWWVKFLTAIVSLLTACYLFRILPLILKIPLPEESLKLAQKLQDLDNFSSIVAHDLQDPLKQNIVFLKMAKNVSGDEQQEYFQIIEENNIRLQKLIKNILELARGTSRDLLIEKHDLNIIIDKVLSDLKLKIKESGATIRIDKMPNILCDEIYLRSIFQNLIQNSIKYKSPDRKAEITVSWEERNKDYLFSVKDNGSGISDDIKPILFAIYKRGREDKKGTGFGLAICKKLVEKHNGTIWCESEIDKGSTFFFTISKYFK